MYVWMSARGWILVPGGYIYTHTHTQRERSTERGGGRTIEAMVGLARWFECHGLFFAGSNAMVRMITIQRYTRLPAPYQKYQAVLHCK